MAVRARTVSGRVLVVFLVLAMVAAACSSGSDPDEASPTEDDMESEGTSEDDDGVQLGAGDPTRSEEDDAPTVVEGEPLDADAVGAVFARLSDWEVPDDDVEDFNRPAETLPPPRTGDTVDAPFPPEGEAEPPEPPSGPLEVLRFQPEGEVEVAPSLSITFNQPMVELSTLEQLDTVDVPVTMTPEMEGRWEWIGTRTLRFEHESELIDRLPMATTYTVEVPAGTTSATGGELADTASWEFTTPPATVLSFGPDTDALPLEPIFVALFDQRVDPAAVLEVTKITADDEERPLRLATEAEVQQDDFASRVVEAALDGRWVAFRPTDPLTPDRAVKVRVGPDIPSAEGPSLNPDDATLAARTYAALQIVEHECGDPCEPGHPLFVRFNNPLDLDTFDPDAIEVTPELPGVNAVAQGDTIVVRGATAGRTTYEVTVPAELGDTFGQTLGDSATVSFDVGPARPSLQQFDQQVVTVDPLADTPALSVFSTNHDAFKVRMFPVEPSEWGAYLISQQRGDELQPPGTWTELPSRTVETGAEPDALTETSIDLTPALDDDGVGHVVVIVEPTGDLADLPERDPDYWANRPVAIWAQATRIGVDAFSDQRRLLAWTTDLATGEPLPDVAVALSGTEIRGTTDADGLATMELPAEDQWASSVVASSGADTALLPGYGNWAARSETDDNAVWYVFDDRGVYRPGETVRVKGWVRRLTLSDARLAPLGEDAEVAYRVLDPQGNELVTDRVALTSQGGFDLEIELPEGANLGDATIEFSPREVAGVASWHSHSFRIDEFRRPDFEVATEVDDPGPYLADTSVTATVEATYFSGGPLPAAPVEWVVTTNEATYTPPNQPAFHFGKWQPWWYEGVGFGGRALGDVFYDDIGYGPEPQPLSMEEFTGTTDADGRHALEVAFGDVGEGFPTTVSAEATVFDVNRQAWSSATDLLVHPGELYVGLRSDRTFVGQGDPLVVEAIVTDIDGEVVAERDLTIEASRLEWQLVDGEWTEVPADTETCEIASAAEPAECRFETAVGGSYEIVAKVADDDGRENHTEVNRWVSGGGGRPERNVQQETLTLIPDAEEYAPGDEVELLVASPFGEAHGLLTITRNGIVETESFTIGEEGSAVLTVPVTDDHVPNMGVQVDLVGATERTGDDGSPLPDAPPRPAFATGRLEVPVSAEGRALAVTATPADDVVDPGGETTLDVEVTDAVGAPVAGAEMAVVVVDEAVLAVTGYELTDPNDVFYAPVPADLASQYLRNTIRLLDPEQLALTGDLTTQAGGEETAEFGSADASLAPVDAARNRAVTYAEGVGGVDEPIQVRTDFDALAVYEPEVVTDASGMATIEVPLPDSLTRYRVMVVAVDGDESFGSAEANITAGLRLMVRPSPPRFLNFGDAFELPVVVQNRTDESMDVDVAVEVANLELTDGAGRRVSVPANDRIEVRFPAAAAEVGTARFRVAGVGGSRADAATGELPVYTPATSEAFATYGVVDEGATVQPLVAPEGVFPQFGGLEVDTSSTALQALTDAVLYLSEYRYESSDAYASRILAISALRDVLEAFSAAGLPAPEQLEATVARDLAALVALQNGDGGFPGWSRGRPPIPYHSIQATHALVQAKAQGYGVPDQPLGAALSYLDGIENHYPSEYSQATRDMLSAYALHVRNLAGDRDTAKATDLYDRAGDSLQLDAVAWLWPVVDDSRDEEILRLFTNRATETAGAATFATDYGEDAYLVLHSSRRTDGIVLDALIAEAPDSDLIPKVVAGLLGNQTRGRWNNVQENSFILLALHRYFETFEAQTPDFVARVWLGDLYAGEHEYRGRSTDRGRTLVSMAELLEQGDGDLIVGKDGPGRLYYRLGLRYAPDDLVLDPLDRGFVVERTYEAVDDPDDVTRADDGTWQIRAGARVRTRLTMVADSRRTHVALVDPLPAGLEPMNPEQAIVGGTPVEPLDEETFDGGGTESAITLSVYPSWWWQRWFEHQNLRDDRAEAFTSLLSAGTYDYTYLARATTPGIFVVPPTKAEEIYAPETFGRSASDTVVVTDAE